MPTPEVNRLMLRVRDTLDREYDERLDLPALAGRFHLSERHLIRTFKQVFGEPPHRYLQRRRVQRAMHLLRTTDLPVLAVCHEAGFTSLGTFGRTFRKTVGETPTGYRARGPMPAAPACVTRAWTRPASYADKTALSEKREARADA